MGVSLTMLGTEMIFMRDSLWLREIAAVPSDTACISEVEVSCTLSKRVFVGINIQNARRGTQVNWRHRSLNPGLWSEVQSKVLEDDETNVRLEIKGLKAATRYEVQTWIGSDPEPPQQEQATTRSERVVSVTQTVFTTSESRQVTTYSGRSQAGRIEPDIPGVTLNAGNAVLLEVEVYGRQDIHDQNLLSTGDLTWSHDGGDSVTRDADSIIFTASEEPGRYTVTARLGETCLRKQADESVENAEARCAAEFIVNVQRPRAMVTVAPTPETPQFVVNASQLHPSSQKSPPQPPTQLPDSGGYTSLRLILLLGLIAAAFVIIGAVATKSSKKH